MWALLIGVPLLLGIGIVVAITMSNRDDPHTVTPPPTVTSTATVTVDPTNTSTSNVIDPLKPLNNTQPPLPGTGGNDGPCGIKHDFGIARGCIECTLHAEATFKIFVTTPDGESSR